MYRSVDVAPSNAVVLVMDRRVGTVPETLGGGIVAATSSCIAVGTREEHDGETTISISDEGGGSGVKVPPVFDGHIDTPSRVLSVCSVLDETFLEIPVAGEKTRVQIWVNDSSEPDVVAIVIVP